MSPVEITELIKLKPTLQSFPYWVAAVLVGLAAVFYSYVFSGSIHLAQSVYDLDPNYLYVLSPICFFFAAWIVERYAPSAAGTGIPRVNEALKLDPKTQLPEIETHLNLRVALVVALSSILCVLGGGGLGREGPVVHIAACMFFVVGRLFKKVWPYTEHRSWILAGGAAGISAAFNAPLAGVVFVLEELAQTHFHKFKTVVISGAIISGVVSQWISGRYLYFGVVQIPEVPSHSLLLAIAIGVICGLMAFPFQKLIDFNWREKLGPLGSRYIFPCVVGLLVATLAKYCSSGTIGGGIAVIENLLNGDAIPADWKLVFGRYMVTIVSHLSGCAGGFLAPSLAMGATVGSKLSQLLSYPHHNLLVLIGMSAFLSAIIRAPFTAWVIVMEMTNQHYAIFPLMTASIVANAVIRKLLKPQDNPAEISN